MYRVDRRVYYAENGRLVDYSEREKAIALFKPKGGSVSPAEMEEFKGEIDRFIPELAKKASKTESKAEAKSSADAEVKKATPKSNKKRSPAADK